MLPHIRPASSTILLIFFFVLWEATMGPTDSKLIKIPTTKPQSPNVKKLLLKTNPQI